MTGIPNPDTEAASLRELLAAEKARADAAEAEHRFSLGLLDNAQATIVSLTSQLEAGKEKPRRMSWEEMDAAGMDYCPRCGDTEHVRRIGSPAVVIECETCTKAIADRSEPNGADRRPYSVLTTSPASSEDVCPTCNGTGKEGRHSICRDCDEVPASSAVEGEAVASEPHNIYPMSADPNIYTASSYANRSSGGFAPTPAGEWCLRAEAFERAAQIAEQYISMGWRGSELPAAIRAEASKKGSEG